MEFVKIDEKGNKIGKVVLEISDLPKEANFKDWLYKIVKYQNASFRQGTSSTKTRSEVRGGGAKPYRQKGLGRARRGTNRSPLKVGGGVIFGPKPRSYKIKMNKRFIKNAIKYVLDIKKDNIYVFEADKNKKLKTNKIDDVLKKISSEKDDKRVFILDDLDSYMYKACRNVERSIISNPNSLDIGSVLDADSVILSPSVVLKFQEILGK